MTLMQKKKFKDPKNYFKISCIARPIKVIQFYYKNLSYMTIWALSNFFPSESSILRTSIKYENHSINTS